MPVPSHGCLAPGRVRQLPPVEQVAILGDGQRAPRARSNLGDLEVGHARQDIHHTRPELVVLAGVPEPPVPSEKGTRCEKPGQGSLVVMVGSCWHVLTISHATSAGAKGGRRDV